MANTSILAAFERMWQHVISAMGSKSDSDHNHDGLYYTESEIDNKLSNKSDTTHKHDSDYDSKGTATSTVNAHNSSTSAHNDIRTLISDLTTKLNNFLDVDDATTDQLSEVIELINNNKDTLESITSGKINVSDIVDDLTTNVSNKPLSAAQGVALKMLIDELQASSGGNAVQADWNQSDETASDYIKNKPFGEINTGESTVLLEEKTIQPVIDLFVSDQDDNLSELVEGETYTVIFNGETYQCIAWTSPYGDIMIGNGLCFESLEMGENVPFIITNYSYIGVAVLDECTITVSDSNGNILLDVTLTPLEYDIPHQYLYDIPLPMNEGNEYIINYNGQEYTCTVWKHPEYDYYFLGNGEIYEFTEMGDDVPFIITYDPEYDNKYYICTETIDAFTMSISDSGIEIVKVDKKYLPKQEQGDWDQNNETADNYIKNRPFYTDKSDTSGASALVENHSAFFYEDYEDFRTYIEIYEKIESGILYNVIINNENYWCYSVYDEINDRIIIGNGSIIDSDLGDQDVPFCIIYGDYDCELILQAPGFYNVSIYERTGVKKIPRKYLSNAIQGDYNQNNEYAIDYIKNRPFYTTDRIIQSEILKETEFVLTDVFKFFDSTTNDRVVIPGETYTVTFNGETYQCVAWRNDIHTIVIGNGSICDREGKGEDVPFVFSFNIGEQYLMDNINKIPGSIHVREAGTYTASIVGSTYDTIKISKKYLPELQADWDQDDETDSGYIKNKPFGEFGSKNIILENITPNYDSNRHGWVYQYDGDLLLEPEKTYEFVLNDTVYSNLTCIISDDVQVITDHNNNIFRLFNYENELILFVNPDEIDSSNGLMFNLSTDAYIKTIDQKYIPDSCKIGLNVEGQTFTVEGYGTDIAETGAEIFNNYNSNIAIKEFSHAEGNMTKAVGKSSHAEGRETIARGDMSHAEGHLTNAYNNCSHAEGSRTKSSGNSSHAEGSDTESVGHSSHAEGSGTRATGSYSHAEGNSTIASGESSHTEGHTSQATGQYSHAEGYATIAKGRYQHVEGKFNIEDTENKYVHIAGNGNRTSVNGTIEDTRSNAYTLDWEGNAWYQGTIRVGGSSYDDGYEVALKKDLENIDISGVPTTTDIDNKVNAHNTSNTSHSDIRDLISGLSTQLDAKAPNSHTTDTSAHSDIRDLITGLTTRLNQVESSLITDIADLASIIGGDA